MTLPLPTIHVGAVQFTPGQERVTIVVTRADAVFGQQGRNVYTTNTALQARADALGHTTWGDEECRAEAEAHLRTDDPFVSVGIAPPPEEDAPVL